MAASSTFKSDHTKETAICHTQGKKEIALFLKINRNGLSYTLKMKSDILKTSSFNSRTTKGCLRYGLFVFLELSVMKPEYNMQIVFCSLM
jgi:hypothetical protein